MVFDLSAAMRKKEEFETARLMEFEFHQRARAVRLLARQLNLDESCTSAVMVEVSDEQTPERLAKLAHRDISEVRRRYASCLVEARAQLIVELGDPTPYRLG